MYFIIYVSVAVRPFPPDELLTLLQNARRHNERANVTGMLLYKGGNFLQILEGEERVVKALYARISRDPRHTKMVGMLDGPLEKREFPDWSMGFSDLDRELSNPPIGYSEFMNVPLTSEAFLETPTRARRLLNVFRAS